MTLIRPWACIATSGIDKNKNGYPQFTAHLRSGFGEAHGPAVVDTLNQTIAGVGCIAAYIPQENSEPAKIIIAAQSAEADIGAAIIAIPQTVELN